MPYTFTPDSIRSCMRLWRQSVDLQMPMADEFKLHFIQERPSILTNFVHTATAWEMMLRCISSEDSQAQATLDSLMADIQEFHAWAKGEIGKLDSMALSESIDAGLDELMNDPAMQEALKELGKRIRKPKTD